MHIITRKRIIKAAELHKDCVTALSGWYHTMKAASFTNFSKLKASFTSVDKVEHLFVFDIGSNKLRLIAVIHFNTSKVFIREILTHSEYDKGKWKE